MEKYEKPVVLDGRDMTEGVFADSGYDDGSWTFEAWWANHNSGSHSEMEIKGHNNSGKAGSYVMVTVTFKGQGSIYSISGVTNCTSWTLNGNTITIVSDKTYNPGESYSFGIPDIRFTNPTYTDKDGNPVSNCSYYKTGDSAHCNCIAVGDFEISYYYSM